MNGATSSRPARVCSGVAASYSVRDPGNNFGVRNFMGFLWTAALRQGPACAVIVFFFKQRYCFQTIIRLQQKQKRHHALRI